MYRYIADLHEKYMPQHETDVSPCNPVEVSLDDCQTCGTVTPPSTTVPSSIHCMLWPRYLVIGDNEHGEKMSRAACTIGIQGGSRCRFFAFAQVV